MPTYATQDDCESYTPGLTVNDSAAFAKLIERAERDIDRLLGPLVPVEATGLKLDLADLLTWEKAALARAVAAQVEYRLRIGAEAMGQGAPVRVSGPDFSVEHPQTARGTRPRIGPEAITELAAVDHLRVLSVSAG